MAQLEVCGQEKAALAQKLVEQDEKIVALRVKPLQLNLCGNVLAYC